jgi:hypothetical protein
VTVASVAGNPKDPGVFGGNLMNAILPVIAANADGGLLAAFYLRDGDKFRNLVRRPIDPATGQPGGAAPTADGKGDFPCGGGIWLGRERPVALAMGPDGAVSVGAVAGMASDNECVVGRFSRTGELLGTKEAGAGTLGVKDRFKQIAARFGVAFTGKEFLAVGEVLSSAGGGKPGASAGFWARVIGWRIKPDGNVEGEPFAVAGEAGRECVLPSVAAGPDGACLVVCSELRGADDAKVVARVVK